MRRWLIFSSAAILAISALAGCGQKQNVADSTTSSDSLLASNPVEQPSGSITPQSGFDQQQPSQSTPNTSAPAKPASSAPKTKPVAKTPAPAADPGVRVDAGTPLNVSVSTQLSSETANVGDTWTGEIKENVIVGNRVVFPAGSMVTGTVTESVPAERGSRARLGLAVSAVTVNGNKIAVEGGTEPIEAGSTRARNLGAVAGSAAAGALIGKAVGGGGKGALIGGLIGGAAAAGAAAKSKGYQVVIKEGTVMTFNVKQPVTVHS